MNGNTRDPMDPLDFLTQEELIKFLHYKKTEISCMQEPRTFLHQLRDHDLVPEHLYKKVIKMKSKERREAGVYEILDWLEKKQGQHVKKFWSCVFQNHILQKYPVLCLLRKSLLDGEKLPDIEAASNIEDESVRTEDKKVKGRKREAKRKKSVEETEEEEEPGPSSCSTPTRKKLARRPTFLSPLKRGEKADIWKWNFFKSCLLVTCGDKKGTLYRDKLAKGFRCILSNGDWFTTNDFEKFAGKGHCKNWKLSIRCQNIPLLKLIQEGHLQCPRMKRQCVRKSRRVLLPVSCSESSSSQSESSVEMEGSNEDQEEESEEDEEDEEDDEEDEEEEDETEPMDLSVFEAVVLPVSCGCVTGNLYKKRFAAGSRSKSIRTEERWFTPEEFVKQEVTLTDGHWKKDILCHEKTLNYLVKMKILHLHSVLCNCDLCCPDEPLAQNNDDVCFVCNSDGDDDEELLCCDDCPRAFHHDCHLPPPTQEDRWTCTFCVWKINQHMWIPMSLEHALDSPITQNMMRCEYLLLCLYNEDTQHVFTEDPFTTVSGYRSVISNPMWLDRVKTKLQRNKYSTVGQFISDIRLIFQNCRTFNGDNDFGMLGAKLSKNFEQKFRIVFNIQ